MIQHIQQPVKIPAAGGKVIEEYFGRVSTGTREVSIAHMSAPPGWTEPPQRPEFNEYTLVLSGTLWVDIENRTLEIKQGEALLVPAGVMVRYSTAVGAEYIAVCLPAFSPELAHRQE